MKTIKYKDLELKINDFFEEINEEIEGMNIDCDNTQVYSYAKEGSCGLLLFNNIDYKDAMPFNDNKLVIDSIHSYLNDNQGLIEVSNGTTITNRKYIFSIVKTVTNDLNTQYTSVCHIDYDEFVLAITAFNEENEAPGFRESMVFNMLNLKPSDEWSKDPYDKEYKKGIRMNLAESKEYDKLFSNHPLSITRMVLEDFFDNN